MRPNWGKSKTTGVLVSHLVSHLVFYLVTCLNDVEKFLRHLAIGPDITWKT